jgi:hypothetical protein
MASEVNGAHQLVICVDDVNIFGGTVQTVKENAEALIVTTKEIGLEVNGVKTKYIFMARDQNAGRNHKLRLIIVLLKWWKSSDIWEQRLQNNILFRQKLIED